ncbi:MAG: DUF599 domain-containing protein, partial [Gammaproteobacteria bacterium]
MSFPIFGDITDGNIQCLRPGVHDNSRVAPLGAYHLLLYFRIRRAPLSTAVGLTRWVRTEWVRTVMRDGRDILAVRTLRNWTMAATFLASTAILIGLGIFNLAITADKQGGLSTVLSHFGSEHPGLWLVKLIILGA